MDLKTNDQKIGLIDDPLPAGALHLGDLGFFKVARFQQWNTEGVYWLSRFKTGTRWINISCPRLKSTWPSERST